MAYTMAVGFPVRNDGSLQYNEGKQRYELPVEKIVELAGYINRCARAAELGRVKDDRQKKHPRSLAKDRTFIEETGRGKFDDYKDIKRILLNSMMNGSFQKCDINYNKEKPDCDRRHAKLIFAYTVNAVFLGIKQNREVYVKVSFTRTGKGLYLHLESLHF